MKLLGKFFAAIFLGTAITAVGLYAGFHLYKPGQSPAVQEQSVEIPPQQTAINSNTVIKYIHNFQGDGYEEEFEEPAPYYMIGMTKDELEKEMSLWNVESFSDSMVVLSQSINGRSGKHYIIKEKDGYVAVFYENGVLKEITNTPIDALDLTDRLEIEKGINIDGDIPLAKALENYET